MSFGFYLTGVRAGGAGFETHLSDSTNVFRSAARNLIGDYARMGDLFNRNQMMRRNANDFTNLNMNIRRQLGALADRIRLMDSTEMEESIRTLRRELIDATGDQSRIYPERDPLSVFSIVGRIISDLEEELEEPGAELD